MTRLCEEDISELSENLMEYNKQLIDKVGRSLAGIAAHALGRELCSSYSDILIAVVPVTCGQGIINGFSQSVRNIIEFMGFSAFVTGLNDVGGLAEAVRRGAKVVFLSDDEYFVAINLSTGKVVDNGLATGKGYAAALDLMSGGLRERAILLLGAGPVGTGAAQFMASRRAEIYVFDTEKGKAEALKRKIPEIQVVDDLANSWETFKFIVDATPSEGFIDRRLVSKDTLIAAPGIPLGLSRDCLPWILDRMVHDPLEIGVATMLLDAIS